MSKIKSLIIWASVLMFISTNNGFAQKEKGGYWLNLLCYDKSNVASNFKIFNGGIITPGKWIGLGFSLADMYSTPERYTILNDNVETKGNYGMLSLITPTLHFIPLAMQSKHAAFSGQTINLLHFYLSYSPWAAINLSNKESEDIPLNIVGKSRVFDVGVAYTFTFVSYLPVSIKAGYINMFNHKGDIYAFHFPAKKFDYFYYGLNISLGAWNKGGLHVRDKYTIVPFIANSDRAIRYRTKMQKEWNSIRLKGSVEAYEKFLKDYPHEDLSKQARTNLDQLTERRDWETAKAANRISDLKAFMAQYPGGRYAGEAKELISGLPDSR